MTPKAALMSSRLVLKSAENALQAPYKWEVGGLGNTGVDGTNIEGPANGDRLSSNGIAESSCLTYETGVVCAWVSVAAWGKSGDPPKEICEDRRVGIEKCNTVRRGRVVAGLGYHQKLKQYLQRKKNKPEQTR
ncbi:hypothetical protein BDP27DRAFT_1361718 [Rhodocollybia butyracea]|uniref:Uncharacterized protein n=1 Tax=Rhodocollybia butyracea TaxID=206335 RepID=A0A9P5PSM2_9AGAR|nr:hypothetical protein BDP27DRAFT_1361718 [Rhodocollybia butyracea]